MQLEVTVFPTLAQRLKILFCRRLSISGDSTSVKSPLDLKIEMR